MRSAVTIDTPRLHLRPLTLDDVPAVLEWAHDPEVVRNFSFFESGADAARIGRYIETKQSSPSDLLLAVLAKKDGGLCYEGNVGLHEWDEVNDNARLGIILKRDAWGHGFAAEALSGLMDHAFTVLGLHKIYLNVLTTNAKGIHIYEKLGFVREGVMRAEYKLAGDYRDMLRMSILRPEWPTEAALVILER